MPATQLENWRWVQGKYANARGVLFGGAILSWVDEDTTMLAYRVGDKGSEFTTAGMDRISFHTPGKVGDRLCFRYKLVHVGKSSLAVGVEVLFGSPIPYRFHSTPLFTGIATLVSIQDNGQKCDVRLSPEAAAIVNELKRQPDWSLVEKLRAERKTDHELLKS